MDDWNDFDNATMYEAKRQTFGFLCVNMWRYLLEKDGEPLIKFDEEHGWGDLPPDVLEVLQPKHLAKIKYAMLKVFKARKEIYSIDTDTLLNYLDWHFSPNDLSGLRMVRVQPPTPRKNYGKK